MFYFSVESRAHRFRLKRELDNAAEDTDDLDELDQDEDYNADEGYDDHQNDDRDGE